MRLAAVVTITGRCGMTTKIERSASHDVNSEATMNPRVQDLIDKVVAFVDSTHNGDYRSAFDAYDVQRRGTLNGDQLWKFLTDAGVGNRFTRGIYVSEIIKHVDTNEDARVSWEEFNAIVQAGA